MCIKIKHRYPSSLLPTQGHKFLIIKFLGVNIVAARVFVVTSRSYGAQLVGENSGTLLVF